MRVIRARNVSEAWRMLPSVLLDAERLPSRNGEVLVCPEPVATVYDCPRERVLLDPRRDANPFFHLVEALWMLAGRDDAESLTPYVRDFGRFAEDGEEIHGAYGMRWRHHFGFDQLEAIVERLRSNPQDRQAVLQMWDADAGFGGAEDLTGEWRDRPCNTHAYFRVRRKHSALGGLSTYEDLLDMTVCCRSNDMVFGGYGANAVQFSVLQEYLAACIGVRVGTYTQVSNNFHVYVDVWEKKRYLATGETQGDAPLCARMFTNPTGVGVDLEKFMSWHDLVRRHVGSFTSELVPPRYDNLWFFMTATAAVLAHAYYRQGNLESALGLAGNIECPAWRLACTEWLTRRADARQ